MTEARARRILRHAARTVPAKYTSIPAPVSSRTHCVYWPDWASNAKVELARGIRMDANYYHYPGPSIGAKPQLHERRRLPDALCRSQRHPDRRLPQNATSPTSRTRTTPSRSRRSLTTQSVPRLLRRDRREHAHRPPSRAPRRRSDRRGPQARGVPVISYKRLPASTSPRRLDHRGPSWNAGTLTFVTTVAASANGLQTCSPPRPDQNADHNHPAGTPVPYTLQAIKASNPPSSPPSGDLPADLLVARNLTGQLRRACNPRVVRAGVQADNVAIGAS